MEHCSCVCKDDHDGHDHGGKGDGKCSIDDAQVHEDSEGKVDDCEAGAAMGLCDDSVAVGMGAPSGWFMKLCSCVCNGGKGDHDGHDHGGKGDHDGHDHGGKGDHD